MTMVMLDKYCSLSCLSIDLSVPCTRSLRFRFVVLLVIDISIDFVVNLSLQWVCDVTAGPGAILYNVS